MTQGWQSSTLCPSGMEDDIPGLNLWELYADGLFTSGSFNELAVFLFQYPPSASWRAFQDTSPEPKNSALPCFCLCWAKDCDTTLGSAPWRAHPGKLEREHCPSSTLGQHNPPAGNSTRLGIGIPREQGQGFSERQLHRSHQDGNLAEI